MHKMCAVSNNMIIIILYLKRNTIIDEWTAKQKKNVALFSDLQPCV